MSATSERIIACDAVPVLLLLILSLPRFLASSTGCKKCGLGTFCASARERVSSGRAHVNKSKLSRILTDDPPCPKRMACPFVRRGVRIPEAVAKRRGKDVLPPRRRWDSTGGGDRASYLMFLMWWWWRWWWKWWRWSGQGMDGLERAKITDGNGASASSDGDGGGDDGDRVSEGEQARQASSSPPPPSLYRDKTVIGEAPPRTAPSSSTD